MDRKQRLRRSGADPAVSGTPRPTPERIWGRPLLEEVAKRWLQVRENSVYFTDPIQRSRRLSECTDIISSHLADRDFPSLFELCQWAHALLDDRYFLSLQREKIDALDNRLVDVLTRRIQESQRLQEWKERQGLPRRDESRELEILARLRKRAEESGMDSAMVEDIWNRIFSKLDNPQKK